MRDLFPGYYQHDPDALSSMMRSATVVLDSSALLNLYRYPSEARKDLLNVLKAISDRLWVPHHVAMEFQQNRATVIAEQMARFRDVKNVLERAEHNLNEDLNQLQLDKRHATIEPKRSMDRIHRAFNDFREELAELEKKQPDVHDVDQIRNALDSLFAGKIGPALTKNAFTQIFQEGKERYQSKIPPGYMDTTKTEAGYFYGEFIVDKQYGDLVV
jgi:hypothetical protein